MNTSRLRTTCFLFALVLLASVSPAHARRGINVPLSVRITAFVNEKIEGIKPDFEWVVGHKDKQYTLYVLNLVSLDGRATALDINNAVYRFKPAFRLAGQSGEIAKLAATPPRQQIVITAFLQFAGGARIMMVNQVETAPEATAAPTP